MWHIWWKAADTPASDHQSKSSEWPVCDGLDAGECTRVQEMPQARESKQPEHRERALAENLGNKCLLRFCKIWWLPRAGKGFIRTFRVHWKSRGIKLPMEWVSMDSGSRQRSELKGSLWSLNPLTPLLIKEKNLTVYLHTHPAWSVCQEQKTHPAASEGKKFWENENI